MRATRAEVAKLAGVSPAVVSYVLNGGPRNVAPETRRRVEEAIASLEYRPNAIAQALRGGRSGVIGVIVGTGQDSLFNAFSPALRAAAGSFGYATHISFADDDNAEKLCARSLVDRQVDALIAIELEDDSILRTLRDDGMPIAVISSRTPDPRVLSLRLQPSDPKQELIAAIAATEPTTLLISQRLVSTYTINELAAEVGSNVNITAVDLDAIEGGTRALASMEASRTTIVCATDGELHRLRWLAGAAGIDTTHHCFASCRIDFHHTADADVDINWDLEKSAKMLFGELIRLIDDTEAEGEPVRIPWRVVSAAPAREPAPRVWDVADI